MGGAGPLVPTALTGTLATLLPLGAFAAGTPWRLPSFELSDPVRLMFQPAFLFLDAALFVARLLLCLARSPRGGLCRTSSNIRW